MAEADPRAVAVTPPIPSPSPPDPGPEEGSGAHPVTKATLLKANRFTRVLMLLVTAGVGAPTGLGAGWYAVRSMRAEAQDSAKQVFDAGEERIDRMERVVEQHLASDAAYKIRQEDQAYRASLEVRELQKVVLTGRSSPILNEPPLPPPVPIPPLPSPFPKLRKDAGP